MREFNLGSRLANLISAICERTGRGYKWTFDEITPELVAELLSCKAINRMTPGVGRKSLKALRAFAKTARRPVKYQKIEPFPILFDSHYVMEEKQEYSPKEPSCHHCGDAINYCTYCQP